MADLDDQVYVIHLPTASPVIGRTNILNPMQIMVMCDINFNVNVSADETKFDMSKIHKSKRTVPYTVLVGNIDLQYQTLVV